MRARLLQRARAQPDASHDEEREDSALSVMAHPRVAAGRSQGRVLGSVLRKDTEHCEPLLRVARLAESSRHARSNARALGELRKVRENWRERASRARVKLNWGYLF